MSTTLPANGITCPQCRARELVTLSRRHPSPGVRCRYLKCRRCDTRFRTDERVAVVTRPGIDVTV